MRDVNEDGVGNGDGEGPGSHHFFSFSMCKHADFFEASSCIMQSSLAGANRPGDLARATEKCIINTIKPCNFLCIMCLKCNHKINESSP